MEINRLYSLAERSGVTVDRYPLPQNGSISVKSGNKMFVAIDEHASPIMERIYLAHELGHCETASFYNGQSIGATMLRISLATTSNFLGY